MTTSPCDLRGLSVLVTRPAHQADALCEAIEAAHGRPVCFPAMEILGPEEPAAVRAQLAGAARADLLIFVSANAVEHAFPLLPETLPGDLRIAAVGRATARRLAEVGLEPDLLPARPDSEGLLALPELTRVAGRRVIIVRGDGGRALLGDTLRARGAEVHHVTAYRRRRPRRDPANLIAGWSRLVDVAVATSNEILDNLMALLGPEGSSRLCRTDLLVVSERMAEHARNRGCRRVHRAASASDADLLAALCRLAADTA